MKPGQTLLRNVAEEEPERVAMETVARFIVGGVILKVNWGAYPSRVLNRASRPILLTSVFGRESSTQLE